MQAKPPIPLSLILVLLLATVTAGLYYLLEHSGLDQAIESSIPPPPSEEPATPLPPPPSPPSPPSPASPAAALWDLCAFDTPERVAFDATAAVPVGDRLRICTYNIQNFADGINDGERRSEIMARRQALQASRLVAAMDPDILLLQEVENKRALQWLNRYFPAPYPYGYVTRFTRRNEVLKLNLAVLSRVPLRHLAEIDFGPVRHSTIPPRGLLRFSVDLGRRHRLLVYTVHLKSNWGHPLKNQQKRRLALEILREDVRHFLVDRTEDAWEVVIAGDLNVDPDTERFADDESLLPVGDYVDFWADRPMNERVTMPSRGGDPQLWFPPAAFDRILGSPELRQAPWVMGALTTLPQGVDTNDCYALPGATRLHVSDHFPVFADITRAAAMPTRAGE